MKKLITAFFTLIMSASLISCNTVKGFGRDVERGGEKVQDASDAARTGGTNK